MLGRKEEDRRKDLKPLCPYSVPYLHSEKKKLCIILSLQHRKKREREMCAAAIASACAFSRYTYASIVLCVDLAWN